MSEKYVKYLKGNFLPKKKIYWKKLCKKTQKRRKLNLAIENYP